MDEWDSKFIVILLGLIFWAFVFVAMRISHIADSLAILAGAK